MSAPIKVTDLVSKSLDELAAANANTGEVAVRHERKAHIYQGLAGAQSAKTANIIAYLNSDRSTWSETDEEVVRVMLGLHTRSDSEEGGSETESPSEPLPAAPAPVNPEPHADVDIVEAAPVAVQLPEPETVQEPTFA